MRTYLDCIPCFFKQALEAARIAGADERTQRKILNELSEKLSSFSLSSSPPQMGRIIYGMVKDITGKYDPYAKIKKKSNDTALRMYPKIKKRVDMSSDRLLAAVKLAIAGNIIDYGVKNSLNTGFVGRILSNGVDAELEKILDEENEIVKPGDERFFNYSEFKHTLRKSDTILYLADNTGETVFDRVLIEEIKNIDKSKKIFYAVKEKPIINDALAEDAYACGIDKLAEVISSGSDAPGTILSLCSKKFLAIYKKADMVISKGQGNFESLSSAERDIFFLFMAKCYVIANDVGCSLGEIVLLFHQYAANGMNTVTANSAVAD